MRQHAGGALEVQTACPVAETELLLVHGMASSRRYWGPSLGPLANRYHLAAPDLLGFGQSPKPDASDYSPETHAAALASVLDSVRQPVIIVGHSLGALLTLHVAARYPQRVRGVVLISLPFFTTQAEARVQLARGSAMARLQLEQPRLARLFCWGVCNARPALRALMPLLERSLPPEIARAAVDHTWQSASRTVSGVILTTRPQALLDSVPADRLLFIHAADDRTAPIDRVAAYTHARPAAQLFRTTTGGHHPYLRHQAETCAAIAAFAQRVSNTPLSGAGCQPAVSASPGTGSMNPSQA